MTLIFVNYPLESFTAGASGALATYIWECSRAASELGLGEAQVVTRASSQPPLPWARTTHVPYPTTDGWRSGPYRVQRKLLRTRHLAEYGWGRRVASAVISTLDEEAWLFLQNSPELAIELRRRLPNLRLLHLFQNQLQLDSWVASRFARSVDVIAAVTQFTARHVAKTLALREQDVPVISSGVDIHQFQPAAEMNPSGPTVIQFVGRTGIEKAPDLLLRAALRMRSRDFTIRIVGSNHWDRTEEDDYQLELQELARKVRVRGPAVEFTGRVDRFALPALMRSAHVHVVPSRWDEPFGLTTLEGMATGLPVVASNTGGTPEVLAGTGLLFERDDVDGLAAHLERLLEDVHLRVELGQAARRRAELMSWTHTVRRINELTRSESWT